MSVPIRAPASTSVTKCRPRNTREAATLAATTKAGAAAAGKARATTLPMANAFREWPEGNENTSAANCAVYLGNQGMPS